MTQERTACVVLALLAVRLPGGGAALVGGASLTVFGTYYRLMITGESLADQRVVSPFVAMWGVNALLLAAAVLAMWRRRAHFASSVGGDSRSAFLRWRTRQPTAARQMLVDPDRRRSRWDKLGGLP